MGSERRFDLYTISDDMPQPLFEVDFVNTRYRERRDETEKEFNEDSNWLPMSEFKRYYFLHEYSFAKACLQSGKDSDVESFDSSRS